MSGKSGQPRVSEQAVVERLLALVRSDPFPVSGPKKKALRDAKGCGAARWVSSLFDQIVTMRASGLQWTDIAVHLERAQAPLEGGAIWTPGMLRRLFNKERVRRERRRNAGQGVGDGTSAEPTTVHPMQISEAGQTAVMELSASRATAVHERAAEAIKPAAGAQSPTAGEQGGQSRWQTRMSLDLRPKAAKPPEVAAPPQATERPRQTKPGRKWDPADELQYWGKVPPDMRLIGPPPDWDGISNWSNEQGGWRRPDGTVLPAQKINRPE